MARVYLIGENGNPVVSEDGSRIYVREFQSSVRTQIQNRLIEIAKAGNFYQISYNKDTDLADEIDIDTAPVVAPESVKCNEVSSNFGLDRNYGRARALKRESWVFDLHCAWNVEVTLEFFEEFLMKPVPFVPKDGNFKTASLLLLSTTPEHPVTQQGTTGTHAKFTFSAELGRN